MANTHITTIFIISSLIIWGLMILVIFKLFCDRQKELNIVKDIAREIHVIRQEIKTLQQ
jgi:hypothetical protein